MKARIYIVSATTKAAAVKLARRLDRGRDYRGQTARKVGPNRWRVAFV